jgi:hypothetical protein
MAPTKENKDATPKGGATAGGSWRGIRKSVPLLVLFFFAASKSPQNLQIASLKQLFGASSLLHLRHPFILFSFARRVAQSNA